MKGTQIQRRSLKSSVVPRRVRSKLIRRRTMAGKFDGQVMTIRVKSQEVVTE